MSTNPSTDVVGVASHALFGLRPYYEDSHITLYHGDCVEIMRAMEGVSVDAVITDPPYCSGGSLEAQKNQKAQGLRTATVQADGFEWFSADNMTTGGLVWLVRAVLVESRRVMKANRSAFVFTDWRMVPHLAPALESSGLRYRNMIVWDKMSAGLGNGFKPAHEIILEYTNGATEYATKDGQNVIRSRRVAASTRDHNCQKPLEVLAKLIDVAVPPGGTVLDPFSGSGSTLVSAKQRGRKAIGIELAESHCETIARRCAQEMALFMDCPNDKVWHS
jgi:DNA modification methylase